MTGDESRKSAFAVLQAASKRASKAQEKAPSQKRPRISAEGGSSFEKCPLCGRATPVALLQSHVNACTGSQTPAAGQDGKSRASLGPAKRAGVSPGGGETLGRNGAAAELRHSQSPAVLSSGTAVSPASIVPEGQEAPSADRSRDAFSKLMQHQRAHSSVHNFYLEAKPDGTWAWHWFLTTARSEAKMLAALAAGPQVKAVRPSEASKGAVDPRLGKRFGGEALSSNQKSRQGRAAGDTGTPTASEGRHERQKTTAIESQEPCIEEGKAALQQPESKGVQAGTKELRGRNAAAHSGSGSMPVDSALDLPQAVWHAMTQLSGSKLGGSPHVKLAIRLLTNAAPGDGGQVTWNTGGLASNASASPGRTYKGSNSLLKSALQKNVRLCRPDSAVRCALHLIKEDPSEFLRRCSIVCLEDAVLHPALPLLVWLMAAHAKGYVLGRRQVGRCLALVHHLASCECRDPVSHEGGKRGGVLALDLFEHVGGLQGEAALLVRCILMRAGYGGMAGDVELLKRSADVWAQRFSGNGSSPPGVSSQGNRGASWQRFLWGLAAEAHARILNPGGLFDVTAVGALTITDVPVSAVDFHVSSIVEELLEDAEIAGQLKGNEEAASAVRRCLWKFSSSLNNKTLLIPAEGQAASPLPADDSLRFLWESLNSKAESWAVNFLARRFY